MTRMTRGEIAAACYELGQEVGPTRAGVAMVQAIDELLAEETLMGGWVMDCTEALLKLEPEQLPVEARETLAEVLTILLGLVRRHVALHETDTRIGYVQETRAERRN